MYINSKNLELVKNNFSILKNAKFYLNLILFLNFYQYIILNHLQIIGKYFHFLDLNI